MELFSAVDGRPTDAQLHNHLLDNADADAKTKAQSRAAAIRGGLSEEAADRMFGPEPSSHMK